MNLKENNVAVVSLALVSGLLFYGVAWVLRLILREINLEYSSIGIVALLLLLAIIGRIHDGQKAKS